MHVVLCGNPGVGKSFIINSVVGDVKFSAGPSAGSGLTEVLQSTDFEGITYSDTPGLDDIDKREKAAGEISQALSGGGEFKLVFVCTLEEGRIKSADLATATLVLDAIERVDVEMSNKYSIIINKCNMGEMRLFDSIRNREKIRAAFAQKKLVTHLDFFPNLPDAQGASDYLCPEPEKYKKFIEEAPVITLPVGREVEVDASNFDEINQKLEEELEELRRKLEEFENRADVQFYEMINQFIRGFGSGLGKEVGGLFLNPA